VKPSSDRPLDEQVVAGLIAAQFPDLAGQPASRLPAGWDNELFRAGSEWILRFPRRADKVARLARESTIMAVVAETLAPRVPVFERIGQPSATFPYPVRPTWPGRCRGRPRTARSGSVHNVICAEHLIADPATGRLARLIDFTDDMAGDPVLDFVGLITVGGYGFVSQVVASYDLPLGDGFRARLEWLSRMRTLTWLADAADHDPGSVPAHLSLVARAFSG
jgi:hypothetical protein